MSDLLSQAPLVDTTICPAQEVSKNPPALAGGVCQKLSPEEQDAIAAVILEETDYFVNFDSK